MNYRLPELKDWEMVLDYICEHRENGEESLSAGMELESVPYPEWVIQIRKNATKPNGDWGKSLTLLCLDKERLVGLLNVRYELIEALRIRYGDIGYGVRPSERRKGYASEMLKHGLEICREKGMQDVLVGCFGDNAASQRVILKNGGMLVREDDSYLEGRISRYYTFEL